MLKNLRYINRKRNQLKFWPADNIKCTLKVFYYAIINRQIWIQAIPKNTLVEANYRHRPFGFTSASSRPGKTIKFETQSFRSKHSSSHHLIYTGPAPTLRETCTIERSVFGLVASNVPELMYPRALRHSIRNELSCSLIRLRAARRDWFTAADQSEKSPMLTGLSCSRV